MSLLHQLMSKHFLLLFVIMLLAFILRLYDLGNLPSGFHNDEASFLLNAEALKDTLRDEDNRLLPVYLISFIDPKPALYSYLQIPFITLLGETNTAARLPAVFLGLISIVLTFLLVKKLLNVQIGLITTFVLAVSPWHIMVSRATQEVIMSFTFTMAAILLLFVGLRRKHKKIIPFSFFFLFTLLSMYSYHSAKIFLPILIFLVLLYFYISKYLALKQFLLLLVGTILVTLITIVAGGFARYDAVSIFSSPGVQLIIDEQIRTATGHTDPLTIRMFANKLFGYTLSILKLYGEYFSVSYLFTDGGVPTRYVVPFHGLFYIFEALFLFLGIVYGLAIKNFRKITLFFLVWMIIVPIPSSLTILEVPSMIRPFPLIIPHVVFIAIGIFALLNFKLKKEFTFITPTLLIALYIVGLGYFFFQFSIMQPHLRPWYRLYGSERLPQEVKAFEKDYEQIHIGSNQYVYFALDGQISISELQTTYPKRLNDPAVFGKITFVNDGCKVFPTDKKVLFIVRGTCEKLKEIETTGYKRIHVVNYKDNNPEYIFFEYTQTDKL